MSVEIWSSMTDHLARWRGIFLGNCIAKCPYWGGWSYDKYWFIISLEKCSIGLLQHVWSQYLDQWTFIISKTPKKIIHCISCQNIYYHGGTLDSGVTLDNTKLSFWATFSATWRIIWWWTWKWKVICKKNCLFKVSPCCPKLPQMLG